MKEKRKKSKSSKKDDKSYTSYSKTSRMSRGSHVSRVSKKDFQKLEQIDSKNAKLPETKMQHRRMQEQEQRAYQESSLKSSSTFLISYGSAIIKDIIKKSKIPQPAIRYQILLLLFLLIQIIFTIVNVSILNSDLQ